MSTTATATINTERIKAVFTAQQKNQYNIARTSVRERRQKLQKIADTVMKYRQEIRDALWADFRKPAAEVDLTEIYVVTTEVKHTKARLARWMADKPVSTPLALMGSTSWIQHEPKGVCLLISPWNYPLNLTFGPLVSAIAAGNTVIIKPSEHTPHCSAIMKKMVEEMFEEKEVAYFEGGVETATALLDLPFNHIFFTGAPEIGKVVMRAAANHLASVTLELGGKSPTIVDETADIPQAANRIAWGKFSNNGQICIAPDYVFVHESKKQQFLDEVGKRLQAFYGEDPASSDYMRMVNNNHFKRVKSYLDDSVSKGARVIHGGQSNAGENYLAPTVVTDVPMNSDLMEKEIFGPVLPVHSFRNIQEVIEVVNANEKPLALYIYSKNKKNVRHILRETRAGGTCINNNAVHFFNTNLPFGGSNNSGIGKAHGWYGFEEFSNARGVFKQNLPGALEMLMPPYTDWKQKIIDLTIKWL